MQKKKSIAAVATSFSWLPLSLNYGCPSRLYVFVGQDPEQVEAIFGWTVIQLWFEALSNFFLEVSHQAQQIKT